MTAVGRGLQQFVAPTVDPGLTAGMIAGFVWFPRPEGALYSAKHCVAASWACTTAPTRTIMARL